MSFHNWSDSSLAYRGIRGYRVNTTMGAGDYYYYEDSDPEYVSYNNTFAMSLYAFVPQSVGAYSPFLMVNQEGVIGSRVIGILFTPTGSNFTISVFTGVTASGGNPGYTVTNSYTNGQTYPMNKYHGINIFYNTTSGNKSNSIIRVNNIGVNINNAPTDNNPTVFTSYRFLNPGTPIGFTLVHSVVTLDSAITQNHYWFVRSNKMPFFASASKNFSTGEKRVCVIDNGTDYLQNLATKTALTQKKVGINPIPIDYVDIEFNVNA